MRPDVRAWFDRSTSTAADWPLDELTAHKGGRTVDVIIPALNEQHTVAPIVAAVRTLMDRPDPLVDDVVVVDTHSSDDTSAVARAAGARVVTGTGPLPDVPLERGKGEAMWRGLAATSGELVVFVDADLRSFTTDYVTGLLGPLLTDPGIHLVKAVYDRPLVAGDLRLAAGGGRVTELLARPLLQALWPQLAGVAQPLSGEYAARRSLLETLPMPCGYGVEIGLLVDTFRAVGLAGIAQVDLGEREHRHQDATQLSRMSAEILHTALVRADPAAQLYVPSDQPGLPVFTRLGEAFGVQEQPVQTVERPPLREISAPRRPVTG